MHKKAKIALVENIMAVINEIIGEFPKLPNCITKMPLNGAEEEDDVMIKNLEDYYHALAEVLGKYSKTQEEKVTLNHNKEPDFQGYPPLEGIYQ
ncbi:MAG: hypothetical protein ACI9DJ_002991 [Algoriphagus sp.]|jgi:hypothetical protein